MSRCKKCKKLERYELIAHQITTHGMPKEFFLDNLPGIDETKIDELLEKHKQTGSKSSESFDLKV